MTKLVEMITWIITQIRNLVSGKKKKEENPDISSARMKKKEKNPDISSARMMNDPHAETTFKDNDKAVNDWLQRNKDPEGSYVMTFRYFVWDDDKEPLDAIEKSVRGIESSIRKKITDSNWQIDLKEMRVDVEKAWYKVRRNTNEPHTFIRVTVDLDLKNALPPDVMNLLGYLETDKEELWNAPQHVRIPFGYHFSLQSSGSMINF